jgi:hypothetical protein
MTEAKFIYELMLRVNAARAKHPNPPPMWALTEEVMELQEAIEEDHDTERQRDEALDVACVALRIAVERVGKLKAPRA